MLRKGDLLKKIIFSPSLPLPFDVFVENLVLIVLFHQILFSYTLSQF